MSHSEREIVPNGRTNNNKKRCVVLGSEYLVRTALNKGGDRNTETEATMRTGHEEPQKQ